MARISEKELILPSLFLMDLYDGKIQTSDLIQKLRDIMQPTGEDCVILSGRNDDKFSQKVRNLKSHETFERYGYAQYEKTNTDAFFQITDNGKEFLEIIRSNIDNSVDMLLTQAEYQQLTNKLKSKINSSTISSIF
jgi:hypothetical protein